MKNYFEKFSYISKRQYGMCAFDIRRDNMYEKNHPVSVFHLKYFPVTMNKMTDLHHRLPNTKLNKKKYPLFLNSIWNLVGAWNGNHLRYRGALKINDMFADRAEKFLQEHPVVCKFVNNPED